MPERITIVGGGLAGLTLGIGLRQRDVPVTVWEAGHYPRHRVCGEFISGRGQDSLRRLGLLDGLRGEGSCDAKSVAFFAANGSVPSRELPEAALSISRLVLDEWLANEFSRLGGELKPNTRWSGEFAPGTVRASGRRPEAVVDGWRFFGLKIHARNLDLRADLEMHFIPRGYVGISRLPGGEFNICGLFRSAKPVPDLADNWLDWLGGPEDSELHRRLKSAQFDHASFCSVAGICLRPQRATERTECSVGDALTMIPPVTGNGMSMAFESAEVAVDPLADYSRGKLNWPDAQREIARRCDESFGTRLRWAAWLERAILQPQARAALIFLAANSQWVWRGLFAKTR